MILFRRFTLRVRALIYLLLSVLVGAISMVFVLGYYETQEYKDRLKVELAMQLQTSRDIISEVVVIGDYETLKQILQKMVAHPDTKSIKFNSSSGGVILVEDYQSVPNFPTFFDYIFGSIQDISGKQDMVIGGIKYGTLEIQMDEISFKNTAWQKLSRMILILCMVFILSGFFLFRLFGRELLPSLKAIEDCSREIGKGTSDIKIDKQVSPEIQKVLESFNEMAQAVQSQKELLESQNTVLEAKVEEETAKRMEQERLFMKQSRLASLGEMIGNIAHQWRQPLNALALGIQDAKMAYEFGELNQEYFDKFVGESMEFITGMSSTIDDFRNFFAPNKNKEIFCIQAVCGDALRMLEHDLKLANIDLSISMPADNIVFNGYQREFMHAVLNLILNAKDAIVSKSISTPRITIEVTQNEQDIKIKIADNADGIPQDIIDKIFDPYFTTKHKSQGTGLGLYISKMIIEQNMGGRLSVHNTQDGACFEIILSLPCTIKEG